MKQYKLAVGIVLALVLLNYLVVGQGEEMPVGLQKIIEYNNEHTMDLAVKISFFVAFLAGILGILSPCLLPFLPAYFSYTFKEKKNITKMTLVFFLGFSIVFVAMGVIAGLIGSQTLLYLQKSWLVVLAGLFLMFLGVLSILGKGISSLITPKYKFKNDIYGVFLFGIFFALGWTACLGPILAGILSIGAILNNVTNAAILMLFYALGNFVPLFFLSVFYDRFHLSENKFVQGKMFKLKISDKIYYIHSTNLIAGSLFILIGLSLVIYKNTAFINKFDPFGTKEYFYSAQNYLINWPWANILGAFLLIVFI